MNLEPFITPGTFTRRGCQLPARPLAPEVARPEDAKTRLAGWLTRAILAAPRPGEIVGPTDLAARVGADWLVVGSRLAQLARQGKLVRVAAGRYRLAGFPS
jgi:hypothetical protein